MNSREQRSTQFTTLRDWSALANAVHETAARVAAREVVLPAHQGAISSSRPLQALLRDDALVREVEAAVVLPLERETVFVLESATWQPVELGRPSSLTMVATPDGVDTGARIVTLRPRAATDWLARVQVVQDGRFADGSQLVGLSVESARSGQVDVSLYWQVPAASDGRSIAMAGRARDRSQLAVPNQSTGDFSLPDVAVRRTGELVVTRVMLPDVRQGTGERTLAVSLQRADGGPIRTIGGADALDVPLGSAPR